VFRVEESTAGSANQATCGKLAVLDPSVHSPNGNVKEVCDLTGLKERCHLEIPDPHSYVRPKLRIIRHCRDTLVDKL
jgi:hypothetical protein